MKNHSIPALALAIACAIPTLAAAQENPAPAKPAAPVTEAVAKPAADVAAVVNDEKISMKDLEAEMAKMMASRGMPPDAIPPEQRPMVAKMILDNMISERLLTLATKDTEVADKDFEAELKKLTDARGDLEKFAQTRGMTADQMKGELRKMMKQRKWIDAQLAGKTAEVTDADAQGFYDKNPQSFMVPEQVRASHVLFMVDQTAPPEKVSEALKKAEAATKRAATEDFAKLAGELSEEPGAKERGGDLDFFPRQGAMVEPFAAAAFALKKGEVSKEPVRSRFGYHVIKVTDRKEGKINTFEESKELIKSRMGWERKSGLIEGVLSDLRSKARITINLPEPAPRPAPPAPVSVATPPVSAPQPKRQPVEAVTPPVSAPPIPEKK